MADQAKKVTTTNSKSKAVAASKPTVQVDIVGNAGTVGTHV